MKSRLEPHFDIAPTNKNNRCAHEPLDCKPDCLGFSGGGVVYGGGGGGVVVVVQLL